MTAKRQLLAVLLLLGASVHLWAEEVGEPKVAEADGDTAEADGDAGAPEADPLEEEKPAPGFDFSVRVEMPELEAEAASNEALLREISALREDFRILQETLNLLVGQMMADVEAENLQLRSELRRMSASASHEGSRLPVVPGGNQDLLDLVLGDDSDSDWEPPPPSDEDFIFEIVQEWGRSPEAAAALGENVSTLKGIVGVVPPGSYRDDIEDLGRELRLEYDAYDNINIEVFDSVEAARQFAERQVSNPDNRVLSVSKHKDSGRDTILYIEGDKTFDVAL